MHCFQGYLWSSFEVYGLPNPGGSSIALFTLQFELVRSVINPKDERLLLTEP